MYNSKRSLIPSIEFAENYIGKLPSNSRQAVLVFLSGLPGSGKSYLSNLISLRIPIIHIESDSIRKILFSNPKYTRIENQQVFQFCHSLIDELLVKSYPVLFDATNLIEEHREYLYGLAARNNAKLKILKVTAPENVIFNRLIHRERFLDSDKKNRSDAGWKIYKRMIRLEEPIQRVHSVVDTSNDIDTIAAQMASEIGLYL
tara:strand:+ start:209 stop:814 length:606 start_codon:yes stop_codon:yes gene_type:complete